MKYIVDAIAVILITASLIVMAVANVAVFQTSPGDSLRPHAMAMFICAGVIFFSAAYLIVRMVVALAKDQERRYGK